MFDHYALGTQVRPDGDDASEEPHLSPRQRPRELHMSATVQASSSTSSLLADPAPPSSPQPIDNLVHELSKRTFLPELRRPTARGTSIWTSTPIIAEAAPLEADDDCDMDVCMDDVKEYQPVADWKRSRRQCYSRFLSNPNSARAIEARVNDMISKESQCNVRPAQVLSSSSSSVPTYPSLPVIEVDDCQELGSPSTHLEVDEGFSGDGETLSSIQRLLNGDRNRSAGMSGSLRRIGHLEFRGSAETALRCKNVVRQRPRMRKRKVPGPTPNPRPT